MKIAQVAATFSLYMAITENIGYNSSELAKLGKCEGLINGAIWVETD